MHVLSSLNILGAPEDGEFGIFKLIVPILIAVFWVVSQIIAAIGKKKPKSPPAGAERPVSLPPQSTIPQPRPQQVPKQQRQVKHRVETRQQQRQRQQQPPRPAPPPLQVRQQPARSPERVPAATANTTAPVAATQVGAPEQTKRTGPNANQRIRALLRPANLKKEFILTEILQSPVGMRNDRV